MARSSPFVIHIETEPGSSFGRTMNDVRSWLDHQHIEPLLFKPIVKADAIFGFEIAFGSEEEALRFQRDFA